MPQASTAELRIFCLCGQKMKVSPAMFGRPGKCIACRQKIRIPRADEIPPDTGEIFLKDHPEFLRRPAKSDKLDDTPVESAEDADDVPLGETEERREKAVPLDVLEPLRLLCSFEHAILKQFSAFRKAESGPMPPGEKAKLMGYRAMVRNARADLDEQLRRRLAETSEQLTKAADQIARASLSVRIGEVDYDAFVDMVTPLRQRRERLERRRENLLGWLATNDPYLAGGYKEVNLEDVPCEGIEVTFPMEPKAGQSPLDECISELRDALRDREHAERKLGEWQRMDREGALSGRALEECGAESEALRRRAWAAVGYFRRRLEQIIHDFESDNRAIKAHLELVKGRLSLGELDRAKFQSLELRLLQAQTDNNAAREIARRAMKANNAAAVPRARGTLIQRIRRNAGDRGINADSWIAWTAALLYMAAIVAPMSTARQGGNYVLIPEVAAALFLTAALLAAAAAIPVRAVRGGLMTFVGFVAACAAVIFFHEMWYRSDELGAAMRTNPRWYLMPGMILLWGALVFTGAAAFSALLPLPRWRLLPPAAVSGVLAVIAITASEYGGILAPRPVLEAPRYSADAALGRYDVTVTLRNDGGRRFWIGATPAARPAACTYLLRRQAGPNSFQDIAPAAVLRNGAPLAGYHPEAGRAVTEVAAGDTLTFQYHLPPGAFVVRLKPEGWDGRETVHDLSLAALAPPEPAAPSEQFAPAPAVPGEAAPSRRSGVEAQLQGIGNSGGGRPQFMMLLTLPTGEEVQRRFALGDTVYGNWRAAEFNPAQSSLTLSDDGGRMLVFHRGERLLLEDAP